MTKGETNDIVADELEHIQKDGLHQNELRMAYNAQRRHDLANGSEHPRGESLRAAIAALKLPSDEPLKLKYDKEYFK